MGSACRLRWHALQHPGGVRNCLALASAQARRPNSLERARTLLITAAIRYVPTKQIEAKIKQQGTAK